MKKNYLLSYAAFSIFMLSGVGFSCKTNEENTKIPHQTIVIEMDSLLTVSKEDIIKDHLLDPSLKELVKSDIVAYKIIYNTESPLEVGKSVKTSGLLLMPEDYNQGRYLSLLSLQHGTKVSQDEAPSNYKKECVEAWSVGTVIASLSKGYMVLVPDYLGYGANNITDCLEDHPYEHKRSLADVSFDMIQAAREFAMHKNIKLKASDQDNSLNEIILAGHSEGGSATLSLHRLMENNEYAAGLYSIKTTYASSGAYNMLETAKNVIQRKGVQKPDFMMSYIWVLKAYGKLYSGFWPIDRIYSPEDASAITKAEKSGAVGLYSALSGGKISLNPSTLYQKGFIDSIVSEKDSSIIKALNDNMLINWTPKAPINLYHSPDDNYVPYFNSEQAYKYFKDRGATVTFTGLSGEHNPEASGQFFVILTNALAN